MVDQRYLVDEFPNRFFTARQPTTEQLCRKYQPAHDDPETSVDGMMCQFWYPKTIRNNSEFRGPKLSDLKLEEFFGNI